MRHIDADEMTWLDALDLAVPTAFGGAVAFLMFALVLILTDPREAVGMWHHSRRG